MSDSDPRAEMRSRAMEVQITTGSRLHFGLLRIEPPFGGIGAMIEAPETEIVVKPAAEFTCAGPAAARVRQVAERLRRVASLTELPACEVLVRRRPPAHHGLGTGTQLAMAVAEGLCRWLPWPSDPLQLAGDVAGRGERSAVGVHGYFHGGLLYEDHDDASNSRLNPIVARCTLPESWHAVVWIPRQPTPTISGDVERAYFAELADRSGDATDVLKQIAEGELLPAARDSHFERFCDAVATYNERSGRLFEATQGGAYNGCVITDLVHHLRSLGARGVGQSSWGPGVFSWCESEIDARRLVGRVDPALAEGHVTRVKNDPRSVVQH